MKKRYKQFGLNISFLLTAITSSLGQGIDPQFNKDAPRIIPPPPNAAALTKFSGADVSLNTGMVKHDIPLYTFSAGKISVPISLSYSSNGVRVDEFPSLTGMSWILNAGGVITRTVNGARDETSTRREVNSSWGLYSQDMYNYITGYGNPFWGDANDTEPDLYSFNFGSYNGKFVLNSSLQPIIFPHSNLKIQTNFSGTTYNFVITDPNGIKYYFGGNGATETSYSNNTAYANTLPHPVYIKTAFYLNKIEHPLGGAINFVYDDYYHETDPASVTESNSYTTSSMGCVGEGCNCNAPCPSTAEKYVRSYIWYNSKLLKEINSTNWGKVSFTYANYNLFNYTGTNNGALKVITNISVSDSKGKSIKTIQLTYNYYTTNLYANGHSNCPTATKRPFLTTVTSGAENYSFEYHSPSQLPVISSFSQDFWGFYNGKNNGGNFISNQNNPLNYVSATADRNPDSVYAKYGLLKKITHPTGGINQISYEGNVSSLGVVGGLRVRTITSSDGINATPITRRIYYYGVVTAPSANGSSVGLVLDRSNTNGLVCTFTNQGGTSSQLLTCTYNERNSNTVNNLGIYNGSMIAYEYVTESIGGDNYEQGGIEHRFRLSANEYPTLVLNGNIYDAPMTHGSTLHGVETNTKVFKKVGSQYVILNETTNNYSASASNYYNEVNSWKVNIRWVFTQSNPPLSGDFNGFDVIKTTYKSYWERLDNTVSVSYDQNGQNPMTTTKYYYYNNNAHLQVTKVETTDSKGLPIKSEFKYPADFAAPGNIYNDMVLKNIIAPVLDELVYNNSVVQEHSQMTYKYAGASLQLIVPEYVKHNYKNYAQENRLQYQSYDNYGNLVQFTSSDGIKNSFIWDYNKEFPVAEIKNATSNDIAATSFEADGTGNWNYTGLQFTDGSAPTGIKVYKLSTGNITKTVATAGNYIVSYWSKNGQQNVNSASSTTGRTINGLWTYYEHKVTLSSNGMVTVSGSGIIDELRLYPEKALMNTLTFDPLVGMTSQCDANNQITYYEYDDFNRLILIRDQDKNVNKKVCYNYSGQTENCEIFYNELQQLAFQKQCTTGYTGSYVTYVIPEKTYLSTISLLAANQKAIDDLMANGYTYAGALGTCTPNTSCGPSNCTGADKKCVNGVCETGVKVYTNSVQIGPHLWECTFHYEWSDSTWSQNYTEESPTSCAIE